LIAKQIHEGKLAGVALSGSDKLLITPFAVVQNVVRSKIPPEQVHALALRELIGARDRTSERDTTWSEASRLATLANLALAVAGRQLGSCDPVALGWAAHGLGRLDYGAAIAMVKGMRDGLPGWPPVYETVAPLYADLITSLADTDQQIKDEISEDHDTWDGWAQSSLTALHAGDPKRVLGLVATARARLGEDASWGLRMLEAYALAQTGRLVEALMIAVAVARDLPEMSRFDQAALLHLLGDLSDRRGRLELAIRYMLDERAVNPPAQATRLHNRRHLLNLLRASGSAAHQHLAMQIAREGLELTRKLDAKPTSFADDLLDMASAKYWPELAQVLELVGSNGTARLRALATGAHAMRSNAPDEAIALLTPLLDEGDSITAHAAILLASGLLTGAERTQVLRRGSEVADGKGYQTSCALELLTSYWKDGEYGALSALAGTFLDHPVKSLAATARTALGALALIRDEHDDAVRWYAEAWALGGTDVLEGSLGLDVLSLYPEPSDRVGAEGSELLLRRIEAEVDGEEPPDVLAEVGLIEAIDRWAERSYSRSAVTHFIDRMETTAEQLPGDPEATSRATERIERMRAEVRRRQEEAPYDEAAAENARYLCYISERLWDQEKLDAALAARDHACRLYEELDDQASLARELGYVGALARQAGRPGEAEATYQRAIAIGTLVLPATDLAFIVGKYGNLLHQRKDFTAAIHQQWRAVCILRDSTPAPALTAESLTQLGNWPDTPDDLAAHWALLLTNLANCLLATRDPLFPTAVDQAVSAYDTGLRLFTKRGIGERYNVQKNKTMLQRLLTIRAQLTGHPDKPAPA
jgi:tetratricopeptide (TPR) repeat protein